MRTLTKHQKKLLNNWFEENKEKLLDRGGILFFDVGECDLFSGELYQRLQQINDTEILYQNINRYISDRGIE